MGKPPSARQREETIGEKGKEGKHSGCTADRGRVGGASSKEGVMFVVSILTLDMVPYNVKYCLAQYFLQCLSGQKNK
jgi:hypothetical protein